MPIHRMTGLPADALALITERTGPVLKYETAGSGLNSEIAAHVHTADTTRFVKGLRTGHPRIWTQAREAAINPHVAGIAPALLHTDWFPTNILITDDGVRVAHRRRRRALDPRHARCRPHLAGQLVNA
ncbi:hypothetical protein [Streptomyces erythrochromogenes]|uniref:hypothetical protein n=1 Tax=Streptomyces erythrochromogenes TaxID=285574 RepID=UPI0037D0DA13